MDRTIDTPSLSYHTSTDGAAVERGYATHPLYNRVIPLSSGLGFSLSEPRTKRRSCVDGVRGDNPDKARCWALVCDPG